MGMDVGTVQSPAVNVTMPGQRQGRRFRSRIQAVSADAGAPASRCVLRGVAAVSLFRHPCLPRIFADSRVRNAERSMFIPPKVSRGGENFGGICMDLSAAQSLQNAVCHRHGCRKSAKPGCKRHNAGAKGRDAGFRSRIKPLAPMQVPIGANGGAVPARAAF